MSKIAEEKALKEYPVHNAASKEWVKVHLSGVCADYIKGYDQAAKDTIERIREKVNHLPNYLGDIRRSDINLILSELEKEYE